MIVKADSTRKTVTGGGVMTTLASPSVGLSHAISMWRVDMEPGQSGPSHVIDQEQIWTLLDGQAEVTVGTDTFVLEAGDTALFPAGQPRRVHSLTTAFFVVCGSSTSLAFSDGGPVDGVQPPWIR